MKTPLLYDIETLHHLGPLRELPREHVLRPVARRARVRAEADELPGAHAPLRQRGCAATASCRSASPSRRRCTATSSAGRCTGCCACSTSPRTTRTSSARRSRSRTRSSAASTSRTYLYDLFGMDRALRALDAAGEASSAPTRSGTSPRARSRRRSSGASSTTTLNEGDGAFYGPKIDLHMTDVLGRSWQMGTIQLDSQMPKQFGLTYMGADNAEHTPYVVHRALLGSLERFIGILIEHYGGAFPFWLAPVQVRVLPVGEATASAAARAAPRGSRRRACASRSTIATRRSASGSATPSSRRSRSWSSTATASRRTSLAVRERGGEQSTKSLARARSRNSLRCEPAQAGADPFLTSRAERSRGFNRVGDEELRGRCLQRLLSFEKEEPSELGEQPLRPRRIMEPPVRPAPQTRINDAIRAPQGPAGRRGRRAARDQADGRGARVRVLEGPRPRRGRRPGRPARRQGHGLREVPVRAGAEGEARAEAPVTDPRQGDQAQAEDRHPRLRDQEGPRRPLPQPAREGQGHDHVPRAGDDRIRSGAATC